MSTLYTAVFNLSKFALSTTYYVFTDFWHQNNKILFMRYPPISGHIMRRNYVQRVSAPPPAAGGIKNYLAVWKMQSPRTRVGTATATGASSSRCSDVSAHRSDEDKAITNEAPRACRTKTKLGHQFFVHLASASFRVSDETDKIK